MYLNIMTKSEELSNQNSCLNKALMDELVFVLLARDQAAPVAIKAWIDERIRLGLNTPQDAKIISAEESVRLMSLQWASS